MATLTESSDTHASDRRRWVVLTGPSGSGKTAACLRLVEACRRRGVPVGGLVTPEERTPTAPSAGRTTSPASGAA